MSKAGGGLLLAAAAVLLGGCESPAEAPASGRIRAVCTTGMVADLVRNIGGPRVDVVQLMGEGVDPHLYKVSPGDVRELVAADVVFFSGLHLEGKLDQVLHRLADRKPSIAVTEDIPREKLLHLEDSIIDPHVWFDVSLWSLGTVAVERQLAAMDPDHAGEYRVRADEYRAKLDSLHRYCIDRLAKIPKDKRVLVTAHDAFGYFGRAYGVEVRSIQGISTDSEAGVREINDLVDFLVQRNIGAVFVETTVNDRNMQALVEGCASRNHPLRVGGELFSDAMGAPGSPGGDYPGMVRHNVDVIADALGAASP
jgi:manganese/zinc/iron transport system substrate-binding protein